MADVNDKAREEFFAEAQEIVEGLGRDVLVLDESQRSGHVDPDLINDVFRAVHTLKGLAGIFGATRMSALSHELENLLDNLRLGKTELTPAVLVMLFRSVESYGRILQAEKDGSEHSIPELDELLRQLTVSTRGEVVASPTGSYELDPGLLAVLTEYEEHRLRTNIAQGLTLYRLRVQFRLETIDTALDELKATAKPFGEIITYLPTGAGADADSIELDILMASRGGLAELRTALGGNGVDIEAIPRKLGGGAAASGSSHPGPRPPSRPAPPPSPLPAATPPLAAPPVAPAAWSPPPQIVEAAPAPAAPKGDVATIKAVAQTVRVDIHKLDDLMNIVGELAIVCTSLERLVEALRPTRADRDLARDLDRLQHSFERHLEKIRDGILKVRMVPLGQVFDKLARVVRQIGREADKAVNLVITGAETEVDKLIVEELSDPLMHMMRNAIDHGIESRQERQSVGKPDVGTIALNAFQKGNHVVIEIEDDGKGIRTERLVEAAIAKGMMTAEEARTISRREVMNLVFVPGLTTRKEVSSLSGRGVGMDVVKTNIGKLGGVIDLQSEPGIGTKISITLPITLAIIQALVVKIAEQHFAIPLANVQEAIVLDESSVRVIDGREMVTLRGQTLQLCHLARLFGLSSSSSVGGPLQLGVPNMSRALDAPQSMRSGGGFGMSGGRGAQGGMGAPSGGMGAPSGGMGDRGQRREQRTNFEPRRQPSMRMSIVRQYIVVAAVGNRKLGLVVDVVIGGQDVVIKALGPSLKDVKGFAGATELADQRLALVLDTPALIEEMHGGAGKAAPLGEQRGNHG